MMSSTRLIFAASLLGQAWAGGSFLAVSKINVEDLEAELLSELSVNASDHHLIALEGEPRPLFATMPKERDGTLSHKVVRYVLQRFFAHKHGWYIRGLEPNAAAVPAPALNASDATAASSEMQDWAPAYLQSFLEKLTPGHGFSLRELAIFAAALQDLIHKEEKGHLLQAYASLDHPTSGSLAPKAAFDVLETYMMIYMLRGNWTAQMATHVERLMQLFSKKVSHWEDTLKWLKQLVDETATGNDAGLDFDTALNQVAKIGDRFGAFNNGECGRLKADLLVNESAKPGRIRLVDFYQMGLQGAWQFNEKIDFLRDIGVLDETDPSTPLVILPNYVQSRSNCLAVSDFYAVCCPNECESLMQHVEGEVVSATARTSHVAKIVARLSSPTVTAPRTLSRGLMQRLQDIAAKHGGVIPIHGRLFGLWMHHAFPRECPFPHASGTTSFQTAEEWMLKTGQTDSTLTKNEVLAEVASDSCRLLPKGVDCGHKDRKENVAAHIEENEELPWDSSEELLVVRESSAVERVTGTIKQMQPVHDLVFWCALSALISGFTLLLKTTAVGKRLSLWAGVPLSTAATKTDRCFA
jgi:hypothetical protein